MEETYSQVPKLPGDAGLGGGVRGVPEGRIGDGSSSLSYPLHHPAAVQPSALLSQVSGLALWPLLLLTEVWELCFIPEPCGDFHPHKLSPIWSQGPQRPTEQGSG